jgi:multiple sugar transport system permease protein
MAGFLATQMISGVLVIGPYFQILAAVELYNTLTGLIIAYVTICLPFAAWMSKGYFDSIPRELDEAGLVDGASRFQIFLRIIMPIALPGTVATLLFAFLLAWQDLLWALCLISIDEKRTVTLGVAFAVGEFVVKWPMLTAASLIGSLPTLILYLLLQRFYVEGLARGAVKG